MQHIGWCCLPSGDQSCVTCMAWECPDYGDGWWPGDLRKDRVKDIHLDRGFITYRWTSLLYTAKGGVRFSSSQKEVSLGLWSQPVTPGRRKAVAILSAYIAFSKRPILQHLYLDQRKALSFLWALLREGFDISMGHWHGHFWVNTCPLHPLPILRDQLSHLVLSGNTLVDTPKGVANWCPRHLLIQSNDKEA